MCLCGFVAFGAISAPHAHAQSNDVLNRIKRIENDVDTLNRAVYKGEKPAVVSGGDNNVTGDLEVRLGQLETDIRNLTGKVEQQSYDAQQMQQKLDALEQDTRMRLDAAESQLRGITVPPAAAPSSDPASMQQQSQPGGLAQSDIIPPSQPVTGAPANEQTEVTGDETGTGVATDAASLYEQGFAEIKREDYAAAEKSFAAFMKKYPKHALAPNALYWLGETYYVRKDYNKASRAFAEAYQKYPKGPKGADNLLKLGMSLAGKGEKDNACIALGQLKKEYPKGPDPVLKRGDQEMATLGCK